MQHSEFAQLRIITKELFRGRVQRDYRWIGNPHALLRVDREVPLDELPWKLRRVMRDPMAWSDYYARTDGINIISFLYWVTRTWLWKRVETMYYRAVLTLMVWGLAYTSEACVPSWKDIGKKHG